MSKRRFRAPIDDFGILAEPALSQWHELVSINREFLQQQSQTIGGIPLPALRRLARSEFIETSVRWMGEESASVLRRDCQSPWIMTGHQPELYHPGVWAKNFAVSAVARKLGGVGVNLVADTDQLKSCFIKVPSGDIDQLSVEKVDFDDVSDGRPFEAWEIHNTKQFNDFGDAIRNRLAQFSDDPLVNQFWVLAQSVESVQGSCKISLARHLIEKKWGFGLLESPMSLWAPTSAVGHIFCTILAELPRFHSIHDNRLRAYRKANNIHSRNHPVADLQNHDGWWESPLWVWRDAIPIRKSLWVQFCPGGTGVRLKIEGELEPLGCLAIKSGFSTIDGVRQLQRFESEGIRIRPRALVTTALSRLLIADLFVHGIGGAIYDELGDQIFGDFFNILMPRYAVCSATLRLADFPSPVSAHQLTEAFRELRRLRWKAETLSEHSPEVNELLSLKRRILAEPVHNREARRRRANDLRQLNGKIARHYRSQEKSVLDRIGGLRKLSYLENLAQSREYSILLHSSKRLLNLADQIKALA